MAPIADHDRLAALAERTTSESLATAPAHSSRTTAFRASVEVVMRTDR